MDIIVDTSVIIAILTGETQKRRLVELTRGMDLLAPASVHWEIGNALAAMLKRKRITRGQVSLALQAYGQIPIHYVDIALDASLNLAEKYDLYAYDAYVITCARERHSNLVSLDRGLCQAALEAGVGVLEVEE